MPSSNRIAPSVAAAATLLVAGLLLAWPSAGSASLQSRVDATRSHEQSLRSAVQSQSAKVSAYQARIDDLAARVGALQESLDFEKRQLFALQDQLRSARARLALLRQKLTSGRRVLALQLRAAYESPQPDVVSLVVNATSFSDLLERADAVRRVESRNERTLKEVATDQRKVGRATTRLARLEVRRQQITAGVLIQRDEVARLERSVIARQSRVASSRDRTAQALTAVRARRQALEKKLNAAQAPAAGGAAFPAHGGSYGFFQAPGTNYSVGDEPEIARRLDRLGKALNLHLIGISGYRSPQHSVEVGGFADDPHTQGKASDTPGVEGVPEASLNRFGLTRPFGGAAEADHIQLAGSI